MLDEKNWSELETLSTEELEALIQADWQQQSTDESDKIYRALTILESRGALACGSVDVDAAWQEFNTHYNTPEGKNACLYLAREHFVSFKNVAFYIVIHYIVNGNVIFWERLLINRGKKGHNAKIVVFCKNSHNR